MSGQLKTYDLTISEATRSVISSQASRSGATPCDVQDGPTTALSGPEAVRANLSARQAKAAGLLTSGTSGRLGTISSESAALSMSLASRLRTRTASCGSTLFKLTWKLRTTPAHRSIFALRASGRPTADRDSSSSQTASWPTTTTRDWKDGGSMDSDVPLNALLGRVAWLASWPSPTTPSGGQTLPEGTSATGMTPDGKKVQVTLKDVAGLAAWTTTTTSDGTGAKHNPGKMGGASLRTQSVLASWPTPDSQMFNDGADPVKHFERLERLKAKHQNGNGAGLTLGLATQLASWPTPMAGTPAQKGYNEARNTDSSRKTVSLALSMGPARLTASGDLLTGSSAETLTVPNGVRLSPEHSRWLMALPPEWASCAPTEMRSSRKSRRPSSKPISNTKPSD